MIRLSPDELKLVKDVGRQFPRFVEILDRWKAQELEALIFATSTVSDTMRGRVQSLAELQKAIKDRA